MKFISTNFKQLIILTTASFKYEVTGKSFCQMKLLSDYMTCILQYPRISTANKTKVNLAVSRKKH